MANYMKLGCTILCSCLLFGLIPQAKAADNAEKSFETKNYRGWYVGLASGFPFAVSTFTSFGTDKARFGWNLIPYVGYRFNPILSVEGQAMYEQAHLSSRKVQTDLIWNDMLLGDLQSDVTVQRYTAQLNINLLGFFQRTRYGRWLLEVSPSISAIGTKSNLRPIKGGENVLENNNKWHFGAGANLQSSYRFTKNFYAGLYTNIHFLTGSQLDGVPAEGYSSNYIWDFGINLGWAFGK